MQQAFPSHRRHHSHLPMRGYRARATLHNVGRERNHIGRANRFIVCRRVRARQAVAVDAGPQPAFRSSAIPHLVPLCQRSPVHLPLPARRRRGVATPNARPVPTSYIHCTSVRNRRQLQRPKGERRRRLRGSRYLTLQFNNCIMCRRRIRLNWQRRTKD